MSLNQTLNVRRPDPATFFAEICAVYIEIMAGMRRAEQIARWLSDKAYYDVCHRAKREAKARELTGIKTRPDIVVRSSKTFLTDSKSYQGVVLLQISGVTRAISIRAELIHDRYRITEINLI